MCKCSGSVVDLLTLEGVRLIDYPIGGYSIGPFAEIDSCSFQALCPQTSMLNVISAEGFVSGGVVSLGSDSIRRIPRSPVDLQPIKRLRV